MKGNGTIEGRSRPKWVKGLLVVAGILTGLYLTACVVVLWALSGAEFG